tara:strand:- start:3358 stop:3906 length:549 start_codon:yes stop_codon:yes gene_type:complete
MREKDLTEGLGELADKAEQDHEVQMARAELYKAAKYSIKLHEMLKGVSESEGLEGWVQAKITKASDYLSSVYHHLDYQEADDGAMAPDALDGISSGKAEVEEGKRALPERGSRAKKNKKYKESLADKLSEAVAKCSDCGNTSYKTLPEEKQKGVDGKVCWKGYKRMGTKKKGGKTVDNCVKM